MEPEKKMPVIQNDEITIKDIILQVQGWGKYILKKWIWIFLFGLIGAGIGIAFAYNQKPKYVAELSFVLEDNKSSSLNNYAGLASQFGIDLGSSSSQGLFSGDNMLEFMKSRLMIETTLLSPIKVDNKEISIADYYIHFTKMNEGWVEKEKLKGLHFPANPDRSKFTLQQDSILNIIHQGILTNNLKVTKPDKMLSFIVVKCTSTNEFFSKVFTERLVNEATDFYIRTKTKRSKANVDILQKKADSLEILLSRKTYSAAASQDLNLNPARRVATVNTELMNLDKVVLQTMYGEVLKNLELSKMSMSQEMPLIQLVDKPILPLKKEKFGRLKGLILGGLLGGFLTMMFLVVRRLYKLIMN